MHLKLLLFALIASSVLSTLPAPSHIAELLHRQRLQQHNLLMDRAAVFSFLSGVVTGLDAGITFDQISACIQNDLVVADHIFKAVQLLSSTSKSDIAAGLQELGEALKVIPIALGNCKGAAADVQHLLEVIDRFSSPSHFIYTVLKNLVIHGVEVYQDVSQGVINFRALKWEASGLNFGSAVSKIFLKGTFVNRPFKHRYGFLDDGIRWRMTTYDRFENLTLQEFKDCYLGLKNRSHPEIPEVEMDTLALPDIAIPDQFDAREQWPDCVHAIRDQGKCGSCWAFAASEALSDRFCIASKSSTNEVLSPQYLVSCDSTNYGCNGGYLDHVWKFMENSGIVTDSCFTYKSGSSGTVPKCATFKSCEDGKQVRNYYVKKGSSRSFTTPTAIKTEILANGPVETGFQVYQDFLMYKGGVYEHKSGGFLGGHAVKIVGWGVESGVKYWICANSWGSAWGEDGFFRIKEGQVGIDSDAIAGLPDLSK